MTVKNGIVFCADGVFRKKDIRIENGLIAEVGENLQKNEREDVDASGYYVIPGLVDIHIHGAAGADFCDGTTEAIQKIARYLLSCGVTSFLGTTMSLPENRLIDICKTARSFINARNPSQSVLRGINLEGPFLSREKKGAQNAAYIVKPDFSLYMRLYEASGEAIKIVAVAPEAEGGAEFIKEAASLGSVSLAHSSADYDTAVNAFLSGADHVTHLFNCMSPFNHREPGIIGAAFNSGAYVELISDGVHLHPAVVKAVFKLFGDNKVCLISDSMRACGLPEGRYDLGGQEVTVTGRTASIENESLAGSVTDLADCLRYAVEFGVPLAGAVKAATINPAKSAGLDAEIGSLTVGKQADILLLGKDLVLTEVIFGGTRISL